MKNVQKIIFVCDFAADYGGNFLACLLQLQEELLALFQIDCCYVFPNQAKTTSWAQELSQKSTVTFCNFKNSELGKYLRTIVTPQSIIHTHFLNAKQIFQIRKATKYICAKIIFHMHMRYGENESFMKRLSKRYLCRGVHFIGVSQAVYEDLSHIFPQKNCFCVPNAIFTERLATMNSRLKNNETTSVLMFGSDFYRKGCDLAIKALNQLNDSKIKLTIVAHDIEKAETLIKKEFSIIPDNVTLQLPVNEIEKLYRSTDIFISPSRSESFGYAVAESAYCGCHVIATDIPGQNTLKNIPGIQWIESENVSALASSIRHVQNKTINPSAARDYVENHYSSKAWSEHIINVYKKIANTL